MNKEVAYLIASLKNENTPSISNRIEEETNLEVFDSWFSPGPRADDWWKTYETARGRTYEQALKGYAATHIFEFDHYHIERADIGILLLPSGKSAHLELGYMIGAGKRCYVLMDQPDRWDVMYQFANLNGGGIFFNIEDLIIELKKGHNEL